MKKKRLAFIASMLIATIVFSGCANTQSKKSEAVSAKLTAVGTFPITEKKVTLKVLVRTPTAPNTDWNNNKFTKWYEEKTNVHIEWEVAPSQDLAQRINLLLASGNYPDVFMDVDINSTMQMNYGSQGIFIPLNDMIEKYSVGYKKLLSENKYVKDKVELPNGNIYVVPMIDESFHTTMDQKMWIYKPWLDKLGLSMPTTTEEFYQVLKAFKEKDPNGNGIADEIPLAGSPNGWSTQIERFVMNAFIYHDNSDLKERMILDNGIVKPIYNTEEYKQGLKYLNKLYKEELISPQSFTQDSNQLKQMGENSGVPILGAAPAGFMGIFTTLKGESGRWLEYTTVPPLKGPNGVQNTAYDPYRGSRFNSFVITNTCKYPEVAFRWADGLYDNEVTRRKVYGVPGVNWEWIDDPNSIAIDGSKAKWRQITTYASQKDVAWENAGPHLNTSADRLSEAAIDPKENLEVILYKETKKYEPYKPTSNITLPPLVFTQEKSAEISQLSTVINSYVDEMVARFITGDSDIDKNWSSYLNTLKDKSLDKYIEIYQEAYNKKISK